ncbi:MAG: hypothetical protein N2Z76_04020 [Treponemataceae bacterium]|nr:hypothetical protein [Treponemataceae bacterium]
MDLKEKLQTFVQESSKATHAILAKVGAKAQDLGEKGVLKLDIAQLQRKMKDLFQQLGEEVYRAFRERGSDIVGKSDEGIASLLEEIARCKQEIRNKEEELSRRIGR